MLLRQLIAVVINDRRARPPLFRPCLVTRCPSTSGPPVRSEERLDFRAADLHRAAACCSIEAGIVSCIGNESPLTAFRNLSRNPSVGTLSAEE